MQNTQTMAQMPEQGMALRYKVFAVVVLVNLTVWLDEGIFGALTPYWSKDLHLSATQIGTGSAAYLLSYFVTLVIGGVLSDLVGARRVLLVVVAGCAVLSGAMLFVHDYGSLVIRNLVFGAFFGGLWASCNRVMAIWLPPRERSKFGALWMSSTLMSFVISTPLGLLMAEHIGWRSAFLIVTLLSVPSIALLLWIRDRPEQMASIHPAELKHIYQGRDINKELQANRFNWGDAGRALRQRSVFWMIVATALATTPTWLIITWGTYGLVNGFKLNGATISILTTIAFLIPIAYGFVHGWVVERIFGHRCRPALALGPIIGGLGFLGVAFFNPPYVVWALLIYACGFMSDPFFWGSINAYWAGLISPQYVGTLNGLSAACQVGVGYLLVSYSGTWVHEGVTGPEMLRPIWLIGGVIFILAAIPVYLAREVRTD